MAGLIVLAVFMAFFSPFPYVDAAKLAEFDRLLDSVGAEVYVVDVNGSERVGRLVGASDSGLQLRVPAGDLLIDKHEISEVDRRRDSPWDGAIKGAFLAAVVGAIVAPDHPKVWLSGLAVYGGLGLALDAAVNARQPLYRARPGVTAKVTW